MKDTHLIERVKIKNFRCFKSLEIDNLKRVNLVGGDNNVGKSAFLEALEIIAKTEDPMSLVVSIGDCLMRRQSYGDQLREFDVINYEQDKVQLVTNNKIIYLNIGVLSKTKGQCPQFEEYDYSDRDNEIEENLYVELQVGNNLETIPYSKFKESILLRKKIKENGNVDFIPTANLDERKLSSIYGSIVDMGMMEEINVFLREFDSRIDALVIRPTENRSVFKLKLKDRDMPVLLSSMGGGLNRYIAIVCAIWKCKNGQLFIDEVENGIHYTKHDKLWEIIFRTSKQANCQIFAATHSRECIESFSRTAEKHDHENLKYVNFSRTVDNPDDIVATVLDSVGLENHFKLGMDVR